MIALWIGLGLFFVTHLVPMTPLKPALVNGLGARRYKAVFSVLSLLGLILYGIILLAHGWIFNRVLVSFQGG